MIKGFTLIETIVYIAILGIFLTSTILCVFSISQNADLFNLKNTTSDEGTFVLSKVNVALTNAKLITSPSTGYSQTLSIVENDGTHVDLRRNGTSIEMRRDSGPYLPLSTSNVSVTTLGFQKLSGTPSGIEASTTITGVIFSIRRYLKN